MPPEKQIRRALPRSTAAWGLPVALLVFITGSALGRRRAARSLLALLLCRVALIAAVGTMGCSGSREDSHSRPVAARPNVIIVSIDTLRADHIGAYGYPRPTTPAIDAFARDAVLFRSCVAHATTTLASHASMLTSLLPVHHGASIANETRLATGASPLAEVLRERGYETASFNGGLQLAEAYGLGRGFDLYESVQSKSASAELLADPENRLASSVARAKAWLDRVDEPFFLFLHSYEIDHPYTPDPRQLSIFEADYAGPLPRDISVELLERVNAGALPLGQEDRQHIVNAYDAELRSADEGFAQLIAYLKARGLYDETLIVLTSDHGEEFGEHGKMGWHSHTLYDELLLVPLIAKLPGRADAGRVIESPVRGIDLAPTVLGVVGIPAPESYAGDDLQRELATAGEERRPAVSVLDSVQSPPPTAIRSDAWKLYRHGQSMLFSLADDPGEQVDRLASEPAIAARLGADVQQQLAARAIPEPVPARPEATLVQQLRSLGYLE